MTRDSPKNECKARALRTFTHEINASRDASEIKKRQRMLASLLKIVSFEIATVSTKYASHSQKNQKFTLKAAIL